MAIRNHNLEAWEDIYDLKCPEVNGARESAYCARTYVDGAWEDVWNDEEFTVKAGSNCTINNEIVTVAFSWSAQSGNTGGFDIYGDFTAGESYTITVTSRSGTANFTVSGYKSGSTTASESYGVLNITTSGQTASITITPAKDIERVCFSHGQGGSTSGSYSGSFIDIMVNGTECTYE